MKRIEALKEESRTIIFYESPHRIIKLLTQLSEIIGAERQASVSREISKRFVDTIRGNLSELLLHFTEQPPKGEFVVVLAGKN